jgi:hypothetical protein
MTAWQDRVKGNFEALKTRDVGVCRGMYGVGVLPGVIWHKITCMEMEIASSLYGKGRGTPSCAEFRMDTEEILRKFLQKLMSIPRIPCKKKGIGKLCKTWLSSPLPLNRSITYG